MKKKIPNTITKPTVRLRQAWIRVTGIPSCPSTINEYLYLYINCTAAHIDIIERKLNQIRIRPLEKGVEGLLFAIEQELSIIVLGTSVVYDDLQDYEVDTVFSKKLKEFFYRIELLWETSLMGLQEIKNGGFSLATSNTLEEYLKSDKYSSWTPEEFKFSEIVADTKIYPN